MTNPNPDTRITSTPSRKPVAPKPPKPGKEEKPANRNKRIAIASLAVLLLLFLSYAVWSAASDRVAKANSDLDALKEQGLRWRDPEFRDKMKEIEGDLTDEERSRLFRMQMAERQKKEHDRMKEFFELSPEGATQSIACPDE